MPNCSDYSAISEAILSHSKSVPPDPPDSPARITLDYAQCGEHRTAHLPPWAQVLALSTDLLLPVIASSIGYERPEASVIVIISFGLGLGMSWYLFRYSSWRTIAGVLLFFYGTGSVWILIAFMIHW